MKPNLFNFVHKAHKLYNMYSLQLLNVDKIFLLCHQKKIKRACVDVMKLTLKPDCS